MGRVHSTAYRNLTLVTMLLLGSILSLQTASAANPKEIVPPTYADVRYGAHERNTLDFWKADATQPTPVIVYIHGGGFVEGDKDGFARGEGDGIKRMLASGISLASINYPYIATAPLQEILRDAARAVQFIRFNAESWNVDKTHIAAMGVSAGAGTSLWLAGHDDMADAASPDPVLRESTRLSAAAAIEPQATYDFYGWPKVLHIPQAVWYITSPYVCPRYYHFPFYKAYTKQARKMRADLDILAQLDPSDPPIYLASGQTDQKITLGALLKMLYCWATKTRDKSLGFDLLHHPDHAKAVENACHRCNIPCVALYQTTPEKDRVDAFDFLKDKLAHQP